MDLQEFLRQRDLQLTSLDLRFNSLGDASAKNFKAFIDNLAKLTQLTSLDLSYNSLGAASPKKLKALIDNLAKLTQLTSLNLSGNSLGDASAENLTAFINNLAKLTQLTSLALRFNSLGKASAANLTAFIDNLAKLTQLTSLDLSYNSLGDASPENLTAFIDNLAKLTQLTSLNLSYNYLGEASPKKLKAFIDNLAKLTQLTNLDLRVDSLGQASPENFKALVMTLNKSKIKQVDLSSNHLNDWQLQLLADHCQNITFTYITLPPPRFQSVRSEAKRILNLKRNSDNAEQEELRRLAGNRESAMDKALTERANHHFDTKVRPYFKPKYDQYGADDNARLLAVEKAIRGSILAKIMESMAIELSQEGIDGSKKAKIEAVANYVKANREKLVSADQATLDDVRSKGYFSARDDVYKTAWRAYDQWAPVRGGESGWANLLTEPITARANARVFTTAESIPGGATTKQASDICRERAAYYYLAAIDENPPWGNDTSIGTEERINNFICYLAEIRRAHNEIDTGIDDPSCFPGHLTRLARMGDKHPVAKLPQPSSEVLFTCIQAEVVNFFIKQMDELATSAARKLLVESLVMLSNTNAADLAADHTKLQKEYTRDMLAARRDFVLALEDTGVENNVGKLLQENIGRNLQHGELPILHYALADVGGFGSVAQSLGEVYVSFRGVTPASDEITAALAGENPFAKPEISQVCQNLKNMRMSEQHKLPIAVKLYSEAQYKHSIYHTTYDLFAKMRENMQPAALSVPPATLVICAKNLVEKLNEIRINPDIKLDDASLTTAIHDTLKTVLADNNISLDADNQEQSKVLDDMVQGIVDSHKRAVNELTANDANLQTQIERELTMPSPLVFSGAQRHQASAAAPSTPGGLPSAPDASFRAEDTSPRRSPR